MSTEPTEPTRAEASDAAPEAEVEVEPPFPSFAILQALAQRATAEERAYIDNAVGWLFLTIGSGLALHNVLGLLENNCDGERTRLMRQLRRSNEARAATRVLTRDFAMLAQEKLTDEEVDAVLAFSKRHFPEFFATLAKTKAKAKATNSADEFPAATPPHHPPPTGQE